MSKKIEGNLNVTGNITKNGVSIDVAPTESALGRAR
jgi:hypothetical protein